MPALKRPVEIQLNLLVVTQVRKHFSCRSTQCHHAGHVIEDNGVCLYLLNYFEQASVADASALKSIDARPLLCSCSARRHRRQKKKAGCVQQGRLHTEDEHIGIYICGGAAIKSFSQESCGVGVAVDVDPVADPAKDHA